MTDFKNSKENTHNDFVLSSTKEIKQNLKTGQTILGIDYGTKRIGVACSDMLYTIASPVKIIEVKSFEKTKNELNQIIKEKNVGIVVYGLPVQMDGTEGETAEKTRKFAQKIQKENNIPIFFWDERLSSSFAENMLINEANLSRKKRKKVTDKIAASFILQGVLDSIGFL